MSYGITLEEAGRPQLCESMKIASGIAFVNCATVPQYSLGRIDFEPKSFLSFRLFRDTDSSYYVHSGSGTLFFRNKEGVCFKSDLRQGQVITVDPMVSHAITSNDRLELYVFSKSPYMHQSIVVQSISESPESLSGVKNGSDGIEGVRFSSAFDQRQKYWGSIESLLSSDIAGKRIIVKAGGQSSLEYHVNKRESYYLKSGKVRVGLRVGRSENHSIVMEAGQTFNIFPGLMHMRMAIEDSEIIEISTKDDDKDSFLVEDGQKYRHVDSVSS